MRNCQPYALALVAALCAVASTEAKGSHPAVELSHLGHGILPAIHSHPDDHPVFGLNHEDRRMDWFHEIQQQQQAGKSRKLLHGGGESGGESNLGAPDNLTEYLALISQYQETLFGSDLAHLGSKAQASISFSIQQMRIPINFWNLVGAKGEGAVTQKDANASVARIASNFAGTGLEFYLDSFKQVTVPDEQLNIVTAKGDDGQFLLANAIENKSVKDNLTSVNIYTYLGKKGSASGFAWVPTGKTYKGMPYPNGVYVAHNQVDATSSTATHELGHHFSLLHTFGSLTKPGTVAQCTTQIADDLIGDTAPEVDATYKNCAATIKYDSCPNDNQPDPIYNFMDYSNCAREFTQGQRLQMQAQIQVGRKELFAARVVKTSDSTGSTATCGDGVCDARSEDCLNCKADCKICTVGDACNGTAQVETLKSAQVRLDAGKKTKVQALTTRDVVYYSGYSTISYTVTTSKPTSTWVMDVADYPAWQNGGGPSPYINGSVCLNATSCTRTVTGLSPSHAYYVIAFFTQDAALSFTVEASCKNANATSGSKQPYCGDGVCGGTETCGMCAADCGACKPGNAPAARCTGPAVADSFYFNSYPVVLEELASGDGASLLLAAKGKLNFTGVDNLAYNVYSDIPMDVWVMDSQAYNAWYGSGEVPTILPASYCDSTVSCVRSVKGLDPARVYYLVIYFFQDTLISYNVTAGCAASSGSTSTASANFPL